MAEDYGEGQSSSGGNNNKSLYNGLKDKKCPPVDASMTSLSKTSVNDGAVRSGAAASPKTLGPRTA